MKVSSRFTVAVHTLLAVQFFENTQKTTSEFIASSVNVNPVVIRRTMQALKAAGILEVKAGRGGARIVKPLKEISLYDIYEATAADDGEIFRFHENPNSACPVGKNIHAVLDGRLADAQNAMERELKKVTLSDLFHSLKKCTAE